jgi:hypothetical protein
MDEDRDKIIAAIRSISDRTALDMIKYDIAAMSKALLHHTMEVEYDQRHDDSTAPRLSYLQATATAEAVWKLNKTCIISFSCYNE